MPHAYLKLITEGAGCIAKFLLSCVREVPHGAKVMCRLSTAVLLHFGLCGMCIFVPSLAFVVAEGGCVSDACGGSCMQGAERVVRVPRELRRFETLPMQVRCMTCRIVEWHFQPSTTQVQEQLAIMHPEPCSCRCSWNQVIFAGLSRAVIWSSRSKLWLWPTCPQVRCR